MDKHCSTCAWDELCGWRFQDGRGYCDKWEGSDEDRTKKTNRPRRDTDDAAAEERPAANG